MLMTSQIHNCGRQVIILHQSELKKHGNHIFFAFLMFTESAPKTIFYKTQPVFVKCPNCHRDIVTIVTSDKCKRCCIGLCFCTIITFLG